MNDPTASRDGQGGRCWGCGYLLRGVESGRCPECGRGFDRADRATMNFGRAMGRVGRRALGRLGWLTTLLAAVGCGLVWSTVRGPVEGWRFAMVDVKYYGRVWEWRGRVPAATGVDAAYGAGLVIVAVAVAWWAVRVVGRVVAVVRYRPPRDQRGAFWRRTGVFVVLCGGAVVGMGVGWPYRVGQRMAREWEASPPSMGQLMTGAMPPAVFALTKADEAAARRAALRFGDARQRTAALKWVVEDGPNGMLEMLRAAARDEREPRVKAVELRLLGLARDGAAGAWMKEQLADGDAGVRAAAADALGLCHGVLLPEQADAAIACDPPIRIGPPVFAYGRFLSAGPPTPPGTREALGQMMLAGATTEEREAAARALVEWRPDSRIRVAEWGVWIANGALGLRPAREQLESIPPFVHHTGDTAAELARRLDVSPLAVIVTKPVIHVTVDEPLAIDLTVWINRGRPWFAYPKPDELPLQLGQFDAAPVKTSSWAGRRPSPAAADPGIGVLDNPALRPLSGARSSYPWLSPALSTVTWDPWLQLPRGNSWTPVATPVLNIGGIGVRWQSVIVSPERPAWLAPPVVPPDARYGWWARLRDVECAWVSNRGEGDRFLYYDGPTLAATPVVPRVVEERIVWTVADGAGAGASAGESLRESSRQGIFVDVKGGRARGGVIVTLNPDLGAGGIPVERALELDGAAAVEAGLRAILRKRGLTESEAAGLLDCWRKPFFEAEGRRLLVILSQADYDAALPMTVRPVVHESVRVGIVLSELGAGVGGK